MQVDAGQQLHHIGAVLQLDPVELHVLAGGEVTVLRGQARRGLAARLRVDLVLGFLGLGQQGGGWFVVIAGDGGQHTQLRAIELTIRHRDPQHGRVALDIPTVLQPQGAEFIVAQRTGQIALQLVAVLRGAGAHKLLVKSRVLVHPQIPESLRRGRFFRVKRRPKAEVI